MLSNNLWNSYYEWIIWKTFNRDNDMGFNKKGFNKKGFNKKGFNKKDFNKKISTQKYVAINIEHLTLGFNCN